jgi:hypothetical protein
MNMRYQLIDVNGWPGSLDPARLSGANYAMHAPSGGKVNPVEEWNVTRMIVNGPHAEHWLNGVKVVEYELWSDQWLELKAAGKWAEEEYYDAATQGHIGLQDHGGMTMFRNIKIREL